MRSLKTRLAKLERNQPKPGVIIYEDLMREVAKRDRMIDEMDADDPRLPGLVPGWQLELIRERKRGEAAGNIAPAIQLDFVG